jgi:hypothetical protein
LPIQIDEENVTLIVEVSSELLEEHIRTVVTAPVQSRQVAI